MSQEVTVNLEPRIADFRFRRRQKHLLEASPVGTCERVDIVEAGLPIRRNTPLGQTLALEAPSTAAQEWGVECLGE